MFIVPDQAETVAEDSTDAADAETMPSAADGN